jgi:hypothetical protein
MFQVMYVLGPISFFIFTLQIQGRTVYEYLYELSVMKLYHSCVGSEDGCLALVLTFSFRFRHN